MEAHNQDASGSLRSMRKIARPIKQTMTGRSRVMDSIQNPLAGSSSSSPAVDARPDIVWPQQPVDPEAGAGGRSRTPAPDNPLQKASHPAVFRRIGTLLGCLLLLASVPVILPLLRAPLAPPVSTPSASPTAQRMPKSPPPLPPLQPPVLLPAHTSGESLLAACSGESPGVKVLPGQPPQSCTTEIEQVDAVSLCRWLPNCTLWVPRECVCDLAVRVLCVPRVRA
jgi:hypothetical protein